MKKKGGALVIPDAPTSDGKSYIDYSSDKIIHNNNCQIKNNTQYLGKSGGSKKNFRKKKSKKKIKKR